jgi:hypothetical protein
MAAARSAMDAAAAAIGLPVSAVIRRPWCFGLFLFCVC